VATRPQRPKTAKRRRGGALKDGERRRLAAAARARRGEEPRRPVAWCDGGVRGGQAAAGFVLCSRMGRVIAKDVRLVTPCAVEEVECAAVAAALERAVELGLEELEVRLDSQVLVDRLTRGRWHEPGPPSLRRVADELPKLGHVSFRWVPREENADVDRMVWAALSA
jgi:probable phosphoglycerate mutase